MTAIRMDDEQLDRAYEVAAQIGAALRTQRRARGQTTDALALACQANARTVVLIEAGASPNVKLGNVLKLLAHVGLTLTVVPLPMVPRGTSENVHIQTHNGSLHSAVRAVSCESPNFAGESR